SSGRRFARSDSSATRAARFADRTDANVATASTSVPPAVASEEIVTQSATRVILRASGGAILAAVDFTEILRHRRMVRNYTDEPVSREALERIARAGRRAPSGGFSQGVRMVVVTDPEMRRLVAELGDEPYYLERGHEPWIS